jgi:bifunctional DNA-binding transcriptional regulator/antitoxin component of YhaV-PrlF toxin-antitoxin module
LQAVQFIGETTLTGKNQITLPAAGVRQLRWTKGDRLLVEMMGNILVLVRRPENWTEAYAGRLSHVFGTHEETLRWLEEERQNWEP